MKIGTDLHTPTVRWLLLLSDKWTVPSILSSMKNESCIYIQAGWNRTEPLRANSDVIYKKSIEPYLVGSPDEKSNWIMIKDKIFSCNTAIALIMQHAGLQIPHVMASWSSSGG